jgi:hypothetical protein
MKLLYFIPYVSQRKIPYIPIINFSNKMNISVLTNSMEQRPSWEANSFSASQEIPAFYGTRRFNTTFTRSRHLSLSWASSIQSIPYPTTWRSILILSSNLRLGLPSGRLPSGLLTKILYTSRVSPYVPHAPPISLFSNPCLLGIK